MAVFVQEFTRRHNVVEWLLLNATICLTHTKKEQQLHCILKNSYYYTASSAHQWSMAITSVSPCSEVGYKYTDCAYSS